jgi:hypothetical protein
MNTVSDDSFFSARERSEAVEIPETRTVFSRKQNLILQG